MTLVFTPYADHGKDVHVIGDLGLLVGTLTFSGNYAAGGDSIDFQEYFKRAVGLGYILGVVLSRGVTGEYDNTNKKLLLYSAGYTEVSAAAYNAALTASPVPVTVIGK